MAAAIGFALSLIVPSTMVVYKYGGLSGTIAYAVIAFCVLIGVHRHFGALVAAITVRDARVLAAALTVALVITFWVGYPIANSGLLGPGSDRDEHIQIGATELLQGRYPYYTLAPGYDSLISQGPGALMLAVPFVLLGHAAYQNLFWLLALMAALALVWRDPRPAVLLVTIVIACAPIVLREYVTGGDLLANSIYVTLFVVWLVQSVSMATAPAWQKITAAIALGIGLSSRPHFALVTPLVFSALLHRAGVGAAIRYSAVAGAAAMLITLPFYLYDPAAFTPLSTSDFVYDPDDPRWLEVPFIVVLSVLPFVLAIGPAIAETRVLLQRCTVVLAVTILGLIPLPVPQGDPPDYYLALYGLSFVFFGVLGFMPRVTAHESRR